jgi:hypothetical protein
VASQPALARLGRVSRVQGRLDGVEVLPSGGILYSSWADSSIHLLQGGRDRQVIREVTFPADIGFDPRRGRDRDPDADVRLGAALGSRRFGARRDGEVRNA